MWLDGWGSHGSGAEGLTHGDKADGLRPAQPAFAGGALWRPQAISAAQVAAVTPGSSIRSVPYWRATWRRSKTRRQPPKALAEKPRLGRHAVVPALT